MAPQCELLECKLPQVGLLGHTTCLGHMPCLYKSWHFNPRRCSHCILFINSNFVGKESFDAIFKPREELERLVRRIRNAAKRAGGTFSMSPLASELKSKITKWPFFQDLQPLELAFGSDADQVEHRLSSASSLASDSKSGASGSRASDSKASGSRASGSRRSRSSKASAIEEARWERLFGKMEAHEADMGMVKAHIFGGAPVASGDPVPGPSRVAAGQPAPVSLRGAPEEPVVLVRAAGMSSLVVTSSDFPVTTTTSFVTSLAGSSSFAPPVSTFISPIPSVPDPFSLSVSSALPAFLPPPASSSASLRPPPGYLPLSEPVSPVSVPPADSGVGSAVVSGLGFPSVVPGGPIVKFRSGAGFSLDFPGSGGRPVVQGGLVSGPGNFSSGRASLDVQGGPASPFVSVGSLAEGSVGVGLVSQGGAASVAAPLVSAGGSGVAPEAVGTASSGIVSDRDVVASGLVPPVAGPSHSVEAPRSGLSVSFSDELVSGGSSGRNKGLDAGRFVERSVSGVGSSSAASAGGSNSFGIGNVGTGSSRKVSSFARSGKRGFSSFAIRDDSPSREDEEEDMDGDYSDESDSEEQYSSWKPLSDPWVILKDGSVEVSIFNRTNKDVIAFDRLRFRTDKDGSKSFCVRQETNKFAVNPRKAISDKRRLMNFCSQFPHYCKEVDKSISTDWVKGWYVSEFTDELLKSSDFPLSQEDMVKLFELAGTNSSVKSDSLKPSLILYLSSYADLVSCLPTKQFTNEMVAPVLGQQAKDLVTIPTDLAAEEHTARLNLLSVTVILSAVQAFSVLARNSASPSALEAAGFSLLSGIFPFLSFAWNQAYVRFCKARTALRKSLFVQPFHHLATRLIIANPFSRNLFERSEIKAVSDLFSQENITWEKLLKLKEKPKKSGGKARSRPYRRAFFRPMVPGRGGQGSYSGNDRYQQGARRGSGRGFGRGRKHQNRGNRGRGRN